MNVQPVSRLTAKLGHYDNIKRVEPRSGTDDRALIRVVNSGIGVREIEIIREFGYRIQSVSMRHNYITVKAEGGHHG